MEKFMLKCIPIDQLKLGMHVHEMCGPWLDHPFWSEDFLLKEESRLIDIVSTNFKEVWIDTEKGLDIDIGKSKEIVSLEVDKTLAQINSDNKIVHVVHSAEETILAKRICLE